MGKANIKILIACHKPSELPRNNLFLPVRVGAALASDDFGLQRDDDGKDNISEKNPGYCELTAIYWAWKNLKADYYGLFHYRRFYSFADKRFPVSDDGHMMIRAKALSQDVFAKYGLLDEDHMRDIIESNDLIVHESRPVRGIPTPMAIPGKSVREHYEYHDGTIVRNSDIKLMMDIVHQKYPDIYPYIDKYLDGNTFLGYNMFIMKRKYFMDMCEFEFGVLSEVEKSIGDSLSERSLNANRIYGYLAEILTSAYIYYLRQTVVGLKVRELQMIYALKTDKLQQLLPIKAATAVVFDLTTHVKPNLEFYFENVLRRFINANNSSKVLYDVIIVHDKAISATAISTYKAMATDRIDIRTLNYDDVLDILREKYGLPNIGLRLVLPWVLQLYDRTIFLSWNTWLNQDVDGLSSIELDGNLLAAALNMLTIGRLCEVNDKHHQAAKASLKNNLGVDISTYFDSSVMVVNLAGMRQKYQLDDIVSEHARLEHEYSDTDILNYMYKDDVKLVGQGWNYQILTDDSVNYIGTFFTPINLYNEWKGIGENYRIGKFMYQAIVWPSSSKFASEFYTEMSKGQLWPLYIAKNTGRQDKKRTSLRDRIAPVGSRRRQVAKALFPKGSRRRTFAGRIYRKVRK